MLKTLKKHFFLNYKPDKIIGFRKNGFKILIIEHHNKLVSYFVYRLDKVIDYAYEENIRVESLKARFRRYYDLTGGRYKKEGGYYEK